MKIIISVNGEKTSPKQLKSILSGNRVINDICLKVKSRLNHKDNCHNFAA